jgi:hypothetical protein
MRMNFCPECGRTRTTGTRYCGGCGRDFGVGAVGTTEPAVSRPPAPTGPLQELPAGQQGRKPTLWIVVTAIVLLAAGGGAFAIVRATRGQPTALPPGHAPTAASRATVPSTHPADTQPASLQASTSPSASASPSPSASPVVSPSVVRVAAGLTSASASVEIVLSHYFQGINDHNYAEYASSQTAQGKADQPESSFDSGYATTTDSGMTLTALTPTGQGGLTATVTFSSRQSPSDSVDDSACNAWILNLYLVPNGAGYLITPAPSGYEPSYTDC